MKIDQVSVRLRSDGTADIRCAVQGITWPKFPDSSGIVNADGTHNREKFDEFCRARDAYYREVRNLEKNLERSIRLYSDGVIQ